MTKHHELLWDIRYCKGRWVSSAHMFECFSKENEWVRLLLSHPLPRCTRPAIIETITRCVAAQTVSTVLSRNSADELPHLSLTSSPTHIFSTSHFSSLNKLTLSMATSAWNLLMQILHSASVREIWTSYYGRNRIRPLEVHDVIVQEL